jgi:iron-sulfur cluster assembly protein|tara:strand:+ start:2287 stop:2601 length:315 start_codon:yes stop_codon:yes gene_type:complete
MIEVTDEAYERLLERSGERGGVRVSLMPGGCAGFEYKFDFLDTNAREDDFVMDFVSFKIAIDQKSITMLDGATLDWKVTGINEEFIWRNPNEQSKCGCGISAIF